MSALKRMAAYQASIDTTKLLSDLAWRGISAENVLVTEAIAAEAQAWAELGYKPPKDRLAEYAKDLRYYSNRDPNPPASLSQSTQGNLVFMPWTPGETT